jgi:glycosyltransferase involved in cell wall biosynthesis
MKSDLLAQFDLPERKISVIPNPVEYEFVRNRAEEEPALDLSRFDRSRTMISIGRLEYEKGHDLLIEAMTLIDGDLNLILVGSGSRRKQLEALVREKGIADRVLFAGFQQNPFALTGHAALFVFPSRYEGFGSALAEALACGLPVATFAGPTAAREIVTPGFNGFLAEKIDPAHLAGAIQSAMSHTFDPAAIAEDAGKRFDVGRVVKKYEDVFENVKPF